MKKILLAIMVFLLTSTLNKNQAQQSVQILYANDTGWTSYCSLPALVDFYVNGYALNYSMADSIFTKVNFGDGTDTTVSAYLWPDSTGVYFYGYLTHYYTSTGVYSIQYIAYSNNGIADTLINTNDLTVTDSCGNVQGVVYSDNNGDCIFNSGDSVLRGVHVNLTDGSDFYQTYTDNNGSYWFDVPNGLYTLSVDSDAVQHGYSYLCPVSGSTSFNLSGTYSYDFGLACNNTFDLQANMSGWGLRPGLHAFLYPQIANLGCMPVSGTITLTMPTLTSFDTAYYSQPFSVIGNTITWNFSNMYSGNYWWWYNYSSFWNCVSVLVDSNAQIGDTLCFTLLVSPTAGDLDSSNNIYTLCLPVRNSCDPNEKEVSPHGIGSNNAVDPNTAFTYTIHFQNTGTDVAFNVFILDTLDEDLDLSSLEIVATSHPMVMQIFGGNILKFDFHNINLPDSGANEALSHGYVTYKIRPKSNLTNGTQIKNKADIYFDFNSAIVTNTTLSTIDLTLSLHEYENKTTYSIYPNPAQSVINIEFAKPIICEIVLTDILGKEMMRETFSGNQTNLDVSKFANGVYLLLLKESDKTSFEKLIINK